jgi:hypothetical protein
MIDFEDFTNAIENQEVLITKTPCDEYKKNKFFLKTFTKTLLLFSLGNFDKNTIENTIRTQ